MERKGIIKTNQNLNSNCLLKNTVETLSYILENIIRINLNQSK